MPGIVTPTGLFVRVGGGLVPLPVTRTPLGVALAALIAQIDAGAVQPCPHCGRYADACGIDVAEAAQDISLFPPDWSWEECVAGVQSN